MKGKKQTEGSFWAKVDIRSEDECWNWTAGKSHNGYGTTSWHGNGIRAHRLAYELFYKESPGELFVCHTCDNPSCCNPMHLFLATHQENMADMVKKKRQAFGDRNGLRLHPESRIHGESWHKIHDGKMPQGEMDGNSKLTAAQVKDIRRLYQGRKFGTPRIAKMMGVSRRAIRDVLSGRTWKHLEQTDHPAPELPKGTES